MKVKQKEIIIGIWGAILLLIGLMQLYLHNFIDKQFLLDRSTFYIVWLCLLMGSSLLSLSLFYYYKRKMNEISKVVLNASFIFTALLIFIFINLTLVLRIAP